MLLGRAFAYSDTHRHRIGPNYLQLPVNRPHVEVNTYTQDGPMAYEHRGDDPVYAPNSFGRGYADQVGEVEESWETDGAMVRQAYTLRADDDDFSQAGALVREVWDDEQREAFVETVAGHLLGGVEGDVLERAFAVLEPRRRRVRQADRGARPGRRPERQPGRPARRRPRRRLRPDRRVRHPGRQLDPGHGLAMAVDVFAGIPVSDFAGALAWYERLWGAEPSFRPNDSEAVWGLVEHGWIFIEHRPEHAGHAMHTVFVDDLGARVAEIAGRGIEPAERETYANGVQKVTYRDPDGNEIGFGGADPSGG